MSEHRDPRHEGDEAFAERIARPLRAEERARDGFESSLIEAIRAGKQLPPLAARRRRTMSRGWWSSPTVRISPLVAVALAAGIAAVAALLTRGAMSRGPAGAATRAIVATAPVHDTVTFVRFVFVGRARSVALVGDFNAWGGEPTTLDQTANGAWTASVPLTNGRHEYAFIVDGERWVADPLAPSSSDDFDTQSSIITVGT
jgi:hypothetical protein